MLILATLFRLLDDEEKLGDYYAIAEAPPLGRVVQVDGTVTSLYIRDMTNKVLHAAAFEWIFTGPHGPIVRCISRNDRWKSADIELVALAGYVGRLMH